MQFPSKHRDATWRGWPYVRGAVINGGCVAVLMWFLGVRWVLLGMVALFLLTCVAIFRAALSGLPRRMTLVPVARNLVPEEMRVFVRGLVALDFQALDPLQVGLRPPALLVPLVSEERRCFATVFRTGTTPAVITFDIVSVLAADC